MASIPHSQFSTDAIPERDRFSAWQEDMSVIFDVKPAADSFLESDSFTAQFDLYHFGRSVLGGLSSSAGHYIRSESKAKRDGLDSILIQLFLEGGVQFGVGQRTTYAHAGDIVIFDLAQPVNNMNQKFRHITSMWPRLTMEELVPNIARWHGLTLPRENPVVQLLRDHMISSYDLAGRFNTQEGQRVEEAMLSLTGAAMAGNDSLLENSLEPPPMKEVLIYRIKRYIRDNLNASDLSPVQIASHFGISRRQLYSLLEPIGGISRYQLHLRLQRCQSDIRNKEFNHLSLSEIAYRWGFNHPATFNRNFKKAFGMTPSEARAEASQALMLQENLSSPSKTQQLSAREHHQWFHAVGI